MTTREQVLAWAKFLKRTREWFDSHGFTEVSTDAMVGASAIDAALDPIKVTLSAGTAELQTSPEFEMKWLLAETKLPIYQICKAYRDDPLTPIHKKEFTMLEFYRPEATISDTATDLQELIRYVSGRNIEFEEKTVAEVVGELTRVDLHAAPEIFRRQVADEAGVHVTADDSWEDVFFKLMVEQVEPRIGKDRPIILRDFPSCLASLAQITGTPPVAKRFEIYWRGMELCNGFDELTDNHELARRIEGQRELRIRQGKLPHPPPSRLIDAMKRGLPVSSGVAVGMDRLFMAIH
jgi:lysyl-tRNA synthetase class 2